MKDGYKDLLILEYEMEFSYLEIGKLLNMNENTARAYLYRARNQFKRLWGEDKLEDIFDDERLDKAV